MIQLAESTHLAQTLPLAEIRSIEATIGRVSHSRLTEKLAAYSRSTEESYATWTCTDGDQAIQD